MINFLQKLAVVWAKNAIFGHIFCRKYFFNHNIGRWAVDFTFLRKQSRLQDRLGLMDSICFPLLLQNISWGGAVVIASQEDPGSNPARV
jgi:hypothetical protein